MLAIYISNMLAIYISNMLAIYVSNMLAVFSRCPCLSYWFSTNLKLPSFRIAQRISFLVRWILVIDHFHVHVHRKIMIDRHKKENISSTCHSLLIFRDLFQISLLELSEITNQLSSIPPENFWFSDDFRENRSYSIRLILEVKSADFLILVVTRQADQKYIQPEIFRHDIMN